MAHWKIIHIILFILVLAEFVAFPWFVISSWKATKKARLYAQAEAIGRARIEGDS